MNPTPSVDAELLFESHQMTEDNNTSAGSSGMGDQAPSMGGSMDRLGTLSSRIRCAAFRTFRFPSLALLHRCASVKTAELSKSDSEPLLQEQQSPTTTSAAPTTSKNPFAGKPALSFVLNTTTHELEAEPMKDWVLLNFLDRWFCYMNSVKRPVIAANRSRAQEEQQEQQEQKSIAAEWPASLEMSMVVRFCEAAASWLVPALRIQFNAEVAAATGTSTASLILRDITTKQPWTLEKLKAVRDAVVARINRAEAFRFGQICELIPLLTVSIVRQLAPPGTLPDDGKLLDNIQVLPRSVAAGNLFIQEDYGPETDDTLLDFDVAFHTSSNEYTIMYPEIRDLTAAHYRRLEARSRLKVTQAKKKQQEQQQEEGQENVNNDDGEEQQQQQQQHEEWEMLLLPPLHERTPFVTFIPRLFATMTHESLHVVQGIVHHADPSKYKMSSEHDPSVFEEPFAFIICKEFCGSSLLGHICPPGLAEIMAANRFEKCNYMMVDRLEPALLPEYEEFLVAYGTHKVAALENAAQGHFLDQDTAWGAANAMAYNCMPYFTESKATISALLGLTFGPPRQRCNLYEVPVKERFLELVKNGVVEDPIANLKKLIAPAEGAAERILRALSPQQSQ